MLSKIRLLISRFFCLLCCELSQSEVNSLESSLRNLKGAIDSLDEQIATLKAEQNKEPDDSKMKQLEVVIVLIHLLTLTLTHSTIFLSFFLSLFLG
jgi:hypothetical protein